MVVLIVLVMVMIHSYRVRYVLLSCKIRFEAPKRQRGTEGDDKDTAKLIYNNIDFSRYDY
jgi:hypothetical protein